jgi:hypothetical protein
MALSRASPQSPRVGNVLAQLRCSCHGRLRNGLGMSYVSARLGVAPWPNGRVDELFPDVYTGTGCKTMDLLLNKKTR